MNKKCEICGSDTHSEDRFLCDQCREVLKALIQSTKNIENYLAEHPEKAQSLQGQLIL